MQRTDKALLSRRNFIHVAALAGTSAAVTGCVMNPVTGKSQFMLMSRADEIRLDQFQSPLRFSADYGALQDPLSSQYITSVGKRLAIMTHRPYMPYNYRVLATPGFSAYTFPAGSMGVSRGLLLDMNTEDDLAAVLGHEIGHVNARHIAAGRASQTLIQVVGAALNEYVEEEHSKHSQTFGELSGFAAGALLSFYSREDERQADQLGMAYMTKAGYNPRGMISLMDILRRRFSHQPDLLQQIMATHPMSEARYRTAVERTMTDYASVSKQPMKRERFMDMTAGVRRLEKAVRQMQVAEMALAKGDLKAGYRGYRAALQLAPTDYAALLRMADCCDGIAEATQKREWLRTALDYTRQARQANPKETMARFNFGLLVLKLGEYGQAYDVLSAYRKVMPQHPMTPFFQGHCQEMLRQREPAAQHYAEFLQNVQRGKRAQYAFGKLVEWGYIEPPQEAEQPAQQPSS